MRHPLAGTVAGTRAMGGRRLTPAIRVRNLLNAAYRDYLSRYKEFAFNPGAMCPCASDGL